MRRSGAVTFEGRGHDSIVLFGTWKVRDVL